MTILQKAEFIFENFNPNSLKSENEVSELYWECVSKCETIGDDYYNTMIFIEKLSKIYGLVI